LKKQHAERVRVIHYLVFGFSLVLLFACLTSSVQASSPITSSGLNTQVGQPITLPSGQTQYDITGGTRPGGGTNLFHSFGDFNVPNNNIANFLNDSGLATSNILGRVTGGNVSNIFGTIQTTGFGNANLFLMNPAGFLFGPNATVNVGGMLAFTSADYLRLQGAAGDGIFYANPAANSVLTTSPVAAFGFLGSNPGAITVQGSQFTVAEGTGISLVGGNITVQSGTLDNGTVQPAHLTAQGGQIHLASVASPGEILTGTLAQAPNINGQSFGNLGTIQVSEQSIIDVSGNGGGTVSIRGGQFVLDNSTISANITGPGPVTNGVESIGGGIDIQVSHDAVIQNLGVLETNVTGTATSGTTYGGIHVQADHINILGTVTFADALSGNGDFNSFTGIRSNVSPDSRNGNSGAIRLDANSVQIKDFAQVSTVTDGGGNGGNILIRANQNIDVDFGQISSGQSGLPTAQPPTGDAGNVELTSVHGNISLTNAPFISSQTVLSPGTAGTITLNAPNGNIFLGDFGTVFTITTPPVDSTGVRAVRAGGGGGILINTNNLELVGGDIEIINGSNLPGGNITLNLSGSLSLRGGSFIPSSTIRALSQGPASSAGFTVNAHDILVTDGSSISTSTVNVGDAGPLNISAVNVELTNGGQLSSSSRQGLDPFTGLPFGPPPTGSAGTVTIQGLGGPAQSVLIDGTGSGILTNTVGTGPGGNINILANTVTLQNSGTLSAATSGTAPSAAGGTITVHAEQVALNHQAVITTDTNGIAPAGVVEINTGTLTIKDGAQIRSSSGAETAVVATALSTAPTLTGGTITVQGQSGAGSLAHSVTLDGSGSGILTQSSGNRPGGDINILTNGSVTMTNGASISASSTGTGNAGNIMVNAGNQFAMTNASVTTEADQSSGGAIKITTDPGGNVQLTNSTISASVLDGTGGGGSVNIDPQSVILQNSQILAQAVQGPGGNIFITTNLLLQDANSVISASSQFGQNGTITIQSPINPAGGKIIPLS
jgi:filamentous hemagglutinin family protein